MYNRSTLKSIAAVAAILSSATLVAEEATPSDDRLIIVTANRVEQNINDTLAAVEVITRQDIERTQPESITDLLRTLAGLDFVHNGGAGQSSSLYTRGTNSDHTLVLVDGVRVGSATLGYKNFASIPVAQIERIEVVKGPRAALWGSDAIGGVIQIFTRKLTKGEVAMSVSLGTDNKASMDFSAGFGNEKVNNTATISYEKSDGYDVFDNSTDTSEDTQPDDDGYLRISAALRGDYELSNTTQLDWVVQFDQGNSEFDSSFGGDQTDYNNHLWNIRYSYQLDNVFAQFSVKQNRDQSISFGNGTLKEDGSVFETRRLQVNGLAQYDFSESFTLLGGIDRLIDDVDHSDVVAFDGSINNYEEVERVTESAYVSSQFKLGGFIGELTGRYDDVEAVKSDNTFNASLGYRINDNLLVSINRSKGFKAPTFNDLYYPGFGNPELQSEISYNNEFLVKANWQNSNLLVAYYDNEIDQLIAYNPACFCSENINKADLSGYEVVYQLVDDKITHKVSASYVDPIDASIDPVTGQANNSQLLRRAKHHYGYEITADLGDLSFFAQFNYVGSRFDAVFGSPERRLESYLQVNLGAGYQLANHWDLKVKVSDFTESNPQTIIGYNNVGQQVFVTLQYTNF